MRITTRIPEIAAIFRIAALGSLNSTATVAGGGPWRQSLFAEPMDQTGDEVVVEGSRERITFDTSSVCGDGCGQRF